MFKRNIPLMAYLATLLVLFGAPYMTTIYRWNQALDVSSDDYAALIAERGYFSTPTEPSKLTALTATDAYPATSAWTSLTLGASMVNTVTGNFPPAKVRLENHGSIARLVGRIEPTGAVTNGATLATLPSTIKPMFPSAYAGRWSGGTAILNISKAGVISLAQALTAAQWLTLDGITFPVKWHDEPARLTPGDLLSLENWYLTTPETNGPQIYNLETGFYEANNFFVDTDGVSVVFSARADGGTTSGSTYPRSELRELNSDGSQASWSTTSGTHQLFEYMAITVAPPVKPEVVFGQIHDAADDVVELMYDGDHSGGAALVTRFLGTEHAVLMQPYTLGTYVKVKMVATGGSITVYINDVLKDTMSRSGSGNYFKAGSYVQSNVAAGDAGSARGTVKFRDVRVKHS